jgi:hypothetical protein
MVINFKAIILDVYLFYLAYLTYLLITQSAKTLFFFP